jgi:hypothetical protein
MRAKISLIAILFISAIYSLSAQTLPVGLLNNVEDAYRRQQLLGLDTSKSSYMIRPMFMTDQNNLNLNNDAEFSVNQFRTLLYKNARFKTEIYLLPVVLQQQFNSHHPYGMNDGSMVQAKGYELQASAGVYAKIGPLSIQLRPEHVYAENKPFQKMSDAPNGVYWNTSIANYYNTIDLPDRFNDGSYSKVSLGQSSIRLNAGPVSVGFSNENLWWGPGVRNSLLMSNNASGFKHYTLNTTRPIKTPIGSFEGQLIAGKLEQSGVDSLVGFEYRSKPRDWRYINGIVVTYQPKWVPNFFVGMDRTSITNHSTMGNSLGDYLPVFKSSEKSAIIRDGSKIPVEGRRSEYISYFARYVLPEDNAEVYFQFGRNSSAYNTRDALVEPEQARGYVFGVRKLLALKRADEFIQFGLEFTQLEKAGTRDIRASESWYNNNTIKDGYTNRGQVLGAGIGPGSNMQSLDVNWVKGLKKIGLTFERLVNNNDLFYKFAYASAEKAQYINRHWVDLSVAGNLSWTYKNFILNSQFTYIRSLNYQYQWQDGGPGRDYWDWNKQDVNNIHLKVGILYRL